MIAKYKTKKQNGTPVMVEELKEEKSVGKRKACPVEVCFNWADLLSDKKH